MFKKWTNLIIYFVNSKRIPWRHHRIQFTPFIERKSDKWNKSCKSCETWEPSYVCTAIHHCAEITRIPFKQFIVPGGSDSLYVNIFLPFDKMEKAKSARDLSSEFVRVLKTEFDISCVSLWENIWLFCTHSYKVYNKSHRWCLILSVRR